MTEEATAVAAPKTRKKKAPYKRLIVSVSDDGVTLTAVSNPGDVSTVKAKAALKRLEKKDGAKYSLIYVVA